MDVIITQYYTSPYGELILGDLNGQLCLCDWRYRKMRNAVDKRLKAHARAEYQPGESAVIALTIRQLDEYFRSERRVFDIPLALLGTDFQKRVWQTLLSIPYGKTSAYGELADSMGNKKSVRAVASANGANAISIIVPCHRIIGSSGQLVGYAGGLKAKERLLALECDIFSLT